MAPKSSRGRRRRSGGAVHAAFEIGVVLKGIDGLLELVGALLLFVVTPRQIAHVVVALTQHELSQDPHDAFATFLLHETQHLSIAGKLFASLYLLSHGVVKVALVWALLKSKLWAYPVAMATFAAFGVYQLYRYSLSRSPEMLALTVLDVFVILLTWAEYVRLRHGKLEPRAA